LKEEFRSLFSGFAQTIHCSKRGEWDFDLKKKPIDKIRVHGPSFHAIHLAQQNLIGRGASIKSPILFMCSSRSIKPDKTWRDEYAQGLVFSLNQFYSILFFTYS